MLAFALALKTMDCFSRQSTIQMNLDAGIFNLYLSPMPGSNCKFPSGVFIYFSFVDQSLDFFYIVTNFNYEQDQLIKVYIDKTLNYKYEDIQNMVVNVSAFDVQSVFSIGKIENMRVYQLSADDVNYFQIDMARFCFFYSRPYASDSTSRVITIEQVSGEKKQFTSLTLDTNAVCGVENVDIYLRQGIARITLSVSGVLDGVITEDEYVTTTVKVVRNASIYQPDSLIAHYDTHLVLFMKPSPDFPMGMIMAKVKPLEFCLMFTFVAGAQERICGTLDDYVARKPGRLRDKDFDDPKEYQRILQMISNSSVEGVEAVFELFIYMPRTVVVFQTQLSTVASVCFANATANITPRKVSLSFSRLMRQPNCVLETEDFTIVKLGQYLTEDDEIKNSAGVTFRLESDLGAYTYANQDLVIEIDKKQYKELSKNMDGTKRAVVFFYRNGIWADDAQIQNLRFYDEATENILMIAMVVGGSFAIVLVSSLETIFQLHCAPKIKKTSSKREGINDDL